MAVEAWLVDAWLVGVRFAEVAELAVPAILYYYELHA